MKPQITLQQIIDGIENEGFDYYFCKYISPEDIEDTDIRALAIAFKAIADQLSFTVDRKALAQGIELPSY